MIPAGSRDANFNGVPASLDPFGAESSEWPPQLGLFAWISARERHLEGAYGANESSHRVVATARRDVEASVVNGSTLTDK